MKIRNYSLILSLISYIFIGFYLNYIHQFIIENNLNSLTARIINYKIKYINNKFHIHIHLILGLINPNPCTIMTERKKKYNLFYSNCSHIKCYHVKYLSLK